MSGSTNTHSRLNPSGAKRWTTCTASIKYIAENEDRIPQEEESPYAAEGTQAHDYAEEVLNGTRTLEEVPEDFRPHVKVYVEECRSLMVGDADTYVEAKVPLFYRPDDTGTVDFAAVTSKHVDVRDLKYGAGVKVYAEGNEQLAIYARSLVEDLRMFFDFDEETTVSIGIVQPRYHGEDDEATSVWELTLADLVEFTDEIGKVAEDIQEGKNLKFSPSEEACRWCPMKGICEARLNLALDALPDFDPSEEVMEAPSADEIGVISDERLVNIYKHKKFVEAFLNDVEEFLQLRALEGKPAAGTKIVEGRKGNTAWVDVEEAEKWLKNQKLKQDERYSMKLITPTQAAKILGEKMKKSTVTKNKYEALTTRADGKKVIALESDKRPAVQTAAEALAEIDDFDDMLA